MKWKQNVEISLLTDFHIVDRFNFFISTLNICLFVREGISSLYCRVISHYSSCYLPKYLGAYSRYVHALSNTHRSIPIEDPGRQWWFPETFCLFYFKCCFIVTDVAFLITSFYPVYHSDVPQARFWIIFQSFQLKILKILCLIIFFAKSVVLEFKNIMKILTFKVYFFKAYL